MAEYEFKKDENQVFEELVKNLKIVSVLISIAGIVVMIGYFMDTSDLVTLFNGLMLIVLAYAMYRPVDNFERILTTQGKDITELMGALKEISFDWLIVNIVTLLGRFMIIPIILSHL